MALSQEDVVRHQVRQADIKQFIQALTPLCGINPNTDPEVVKLANEKLKMILPLISLEIKEAVIKPIGRA